MPIKNDYFLRVQDVVVARVFSRVFLSAGLDWMDTKLDGH